MKSIMRLLPAAVLIALISPAYAGAWAGDYGGRGWSPGLCFFFAWWPVGWAGWAGLILSLVLWALVIAGLFFLLRRLAGSRDKSGFREAAIRAYDNLATRYVRGEITREQFELAKREIL